MSILAVMKAKLGLSSTPANNFTLTAEADNGTMKLARGNPGATTQDILTVDAAGKVDLPTLVRSMGPEGSYTLPGGLIIKWGPCTSQVSTALAKTFPTPFPNACFVVHVTNAHPTVGTLYAEQVTAISTTGFSVGNGSTTHNAYYLAIGN